MANLGDISKTFANTPELSSYGIFGLDNRGVNVSMQPVAGQLSEVPFSFVVLTRNAVLNDRSRSDGTGLWAFYDMDDSGSQVYSISAYTQSGPTGEAWTATVVSGVATVTKVFASQRAVAAAFT